MNELQHCIDIALQGNAEETNYANKMFHDIIVQSSSNPFIINDPSLIEKHQQI